VSTPKWYNLYVRLATKWGYCENQPTHTIASNDSSSSMSSVDISQGGAGDPSPGKIKFVENDIDYSVFSRF